MADSRQLAPILAEIGTGIFAVLDGAQFYDLPMALFDGQFVHRPLYLNQGNSTADQIKTAPQLVWIDRTSSQDSGEPKSKNFPLDAAVLDRLLDLVGERPAVVFWECKKGGDVLYRHLRGINKVLYPKDAYLSRDIAIPESGFEMVVLRHADANVIAQIASALDWAGLARLVGSADALLFKPDDDWNEKPARVQRNASMPATRNHPLRIGRAEIARMDAKRFEWLTTRTARYLREYAEDRIEGKTNRELRADVQCWLREAGALGVTQEAAFRKWCYLQLLYNGQMGKSADAPNLSTGRADTMSADERVHRLMTKIVEDTEAA